MAGTPIDPSFQFMAVTKSDTAILMYKAPYETAPHAVATKGIYVGGAGNLAVTNDNGDSVTFTGVLAGVVYPINTRQILSTGTTATAIVALL